VKDFSGRELKLNDFNIFSGNSDTSNYDVIIPPDTDKLLLSLQGYYSGQRIFYITIITTQRFSKRSSSYYPGSDIPPSKLILLVFIYSNIIAKFHEINFPNVKDNIIDVIKMR
jgi:hypothetical protein